jgi:hypothetical protein
MKKLQDLAASFSHQVATWVPDMVCDFYLGKSHKIANNSANTKARKNKQRFGIVKILELFDICLAYLKAIKFYLIKLATYF